jgi:hypothetical protein
VCDGDPTLLQVRFGQSAQQELPEVHHRLEDRKWRLGRMKIPPAIDRG